MLEREFQWFLKNQKKLVKKYKGKVLVIVGEEVKGVFENDTEAYGYAVKNFDYGSFLIQHCTEGTEAYTYTFNTNAIF